MSPRPRLLLVFHSSRRGGAERFGIAELQALSERFDVLASAPDGPLAPEIEAVCDRLDGIGIVPLWGGGAGGWLRAAARTARDARRFMRVLREQRIDLVVTNSSTCLAAVIGARLARVPVIVRARDWPASRLSPVVFRLEARLASAIFAESDLLGRAFRGGTVLTIPDGVRLATAPRAAAPPGPPFTVLQVGGLDPRKRQDLAIRALALVRRGGLDARLVLAGRVTDEGYAASLEPLVASLGVGEHVIFAGELDRLDETYARTHVVVSPASGEWTPMWLMEALGHGVPAVACRTGSVDEIVVDRHTGLLVERTPQDVADGLTALLSDAPLADRLGRAGAAHVRADYDRDRLLAAMVAATADVLSTRSASRAGGSGRSRG